MKLQLNEYFDLLENGTIKELGDYYDQEKPWERFVRESEIRVYESKRAERECQELCQILKQHKIKTQL
ncbi:MAG TPA: hypothetical protein H9887_07575 [Candidatus Dorea intestinavium]|nr:hypothetical protein [Candidatus Dorea intestinavium]